MKKDPPHVVKSKLNFVPAEKAKPKSEKLEVNDRNSHQISFSFYGGTIVLVTFVFAPFEPEV